MRKNLREGVNDRRNPKKMWTLTACRTFSQELVSFLFLFLSGNQFPFNLPPPFHKSLVAAIED